MKVTREHDPETAAARVRGDASTVTLRPGPRTTVLSDVVVNNAETLYRDGHRTIAALADLAALCQAALESDRLIVSPAVFEASTFLRQLSFVTPTALPADAHAAALRDDRWIASLFVPDYEKPGVDRARYLSDKLPLFLFMLQAWKGAGKFASEEARQGLLAHLAPTRSAYGAYAEALFSLTDAHGTGVLFSCLEQPLADTLAVDRVAPDVHSEGLAGDLRPRLEAALVADRAEYFEAWGLPALGLMTLGEARFLPDLPATLEDLRETYAGARSRLTALGEEKRALMGEGGPLDDRAYPRVLEIERNIAQAWKDFDASVDAARKPERLRTAERVFNVDRYLKMLTAKLGLGSVGALVRSAGLPARYNMSYVPGLSRAAAFVRRSDARSLYEIVDRIIDQPRPAVEREVAELRAVSERSERYSRFADGAAGEDLELHHDPEVGDVPHSIYWMARVLQMMDGG